jgi:hypothetical protein
MATKGETMIEPTDHSLAAARELLGNGSGRPRICVHDDRYFATQCDTCIALALDAAEKRGEQRAYRYALAFVQNTNRVTRAEIDEWLEEAGKR